MKNMSAKPLLTDLPARQPAQGWKAPFKAGDRLIVRCSGEAALTPEGRRGIIRMVTKFAGADVRVFVADPLKTSMTLTRQGEVIDLVEPPRPSELVPNGCPTVMNLDCAVIEFTTGNRLWVTTERLTAAEEQLFVRQLVEWAGGDVEIIVNERPVCRKA